jgi:predicted Rossmann fold nucleotide-binding protein DprA/Smf involved in DNA uptake
MSVSAQTQAVLLLTGHFAKPNKGDPRPLTPQEWGRLLPWLEDHDLRPETLLSDDPARLMAGWLDKTVTVHRITALLDRGAALGLALERWQRAGLWVMTRYDPDYPDRLRQRLRGAAPPLLLGWGSRSLLSAGGLAVVGSREADEDDLSFAAQLGIEASSHGLSVVSGGARGVDEAALLGALDRDGNAVGVLADSLLRAATSPKYRRHLASGNLALVSPFNPEAGFDVGNAMARNRYIYCLADAAVVVSSTRDKGGTWAGAVENLRERWVPLWIKPTSDAESGNAELVRRGARWLPERRPDLSALSADAEGKRVQAESEPASLDLRMMAKTVNQDMGGKTQLPDEPGIASPTSFAESKPSRCEESADTPSTYELFLLGMELAASDKPLTPDQVRDHFKVARSVLNGWLKRAAQEGRIEKLSKPVRYRWQDGSPQQGLMFAREEMGRRVRKTGR